MMFHCPHYHHAIWCHSLPLTPPSLVPSTPTYAAINANTLTLVLSASVNPNTLCCTYTLHLPTLCELIICARHIIPCCLVSSCLLHTNMPLPLMSHWSNITIICQFRAHIWHIFSLTLSSLHVLLICKCCAHMLHLLSASSHLIPVHRKSLN